MFYIPVILGSIRRNRESAKVAEFAVGFLRRLEGISTELLDLKKINLPIMEERLSFREEAPTSALELGARINRADSIVIVEPEYSSGYPGVLKNALDYLKPECRRKPFGIITVSSRKAECCALFRCAR
jgi:NAD(P)H-dependent FMN reductase